MPLVLLSYLAFISMALPSGLLGVAWPAMRHSLAVPVSALGILLPIAVLSSLAASAATGFVLGRIGVGRLLAGTTLLSALGLLATGLAPRFWVLVLATMLLAASSGAIDSALNAYAARHFTARHINWMHASFGVGATVGPLLVGATLAAGWSWRWSYAGLAVVQVLFAAVFLATAARWRATPPPPPPPPSTTTPPTTTGRGWRALPVRAAARGALIFAVENGLESGTTLWAYLFLTEGRGLARGVAAGTVSAYWIVLCAARLVLGPVADRYGVGRVLAGAVGTMVLGAGLLVLPGAPAVAVTGVLLIGLGAAPMFPLLTLTTRDRVEPRYVDQTVGVQVAASAVGSALLPAVIGVLIGWSGARAVGPALLALALITAAAYAAPAIRSRPAPTAVGQ